MSTLPITSVQEQYGVILHHAIEAGDQFTRLQNCDDVRLERVYDLVYADMLEHQYDTTTGARPANIFRITDEGRKYYSVFKSTVLFKPDLWNVEEESALMQYYMLGGDLQFFFPRVMAFLNDERIDHVERSRVAEHMVKTDNGYYQAIARTWLDKPYATQWIPDDATIRTSWGNNDDEKALTIRLSHIGALALRRILGHVTDHEWRSYSRGHFGSESLSAEIAMIIVASRLNELL